MGDEKKVDIEKRKNEILGILLITLALFSGIALFSDSGGVLGKVFAEFYISLLGIGAFLIPFLLLLWGITLIRLKGLKFNSKLSGFLLTYITIMAFIHTYLYSEFPLEYALKGKGGGLIGGGYSWLFLQMLGRLGSFILFSALLLIGVLLWFDVLLQSIIEKIQYYFERLRNRVVQYYINKKEKYRGESNELLPETSDQAATTEVDITDYEVEEEYETEKTEEDKDEIENNIIDGDRYVLPRLSLLKGSKKNKFKVSKKNKLLEETLSSFGVEAKVIDVSYGPTITRYEVQPASGVKVSKIVNLADDISLALAAPDVRIEAPIPGKAAVGIEVPHGGNNLVRLKDILASKAFQRASSNLTLALGKGIEGKPITANLTQMPHLLVAGATGSGKSVCINSFITSILYKSKPDEVKMILVDPKKVELSNYQGLPHLFTPVVTDPKKAANVLKLVVKEMEDRYELFSESGTRGITSYNKNVEEEDKLPYIVVIIDELSDLMMVAASEVEDNICRLAQMSRAAGIHLIIATQRPSVDVITGLIKANIPSRISFAVSSQTDSRTILDMGGAEKLLGNGDMLYSPVDKQKPQRIQGAFIDNGEINEVVDFIKMQANPEFEVEPDEIKEIEINLDNDKDELYEEAVKLVVQYRASISMLQRRLHIGHSRAARLIDVMEDEGIVGPYAGSKPREVLISEEELDNYIEYNEFNDQDEEGN